MSYLLDTNVCIALLNADRPAVHGHFVKACAASIPIFVSSVAIFELWYGVVKSTRRKMNQERLDLFLAGPIEVLPFQQQDAIEAGGIRRTLEVAGKPIGYYDLLMAGQAIANGLTLVTANTSEFARVKGLRCLDWSKA